MTRKEAVDRLEALRIKRDKEAAHMEADDILCAMLLSVGFADVVNEFNKLDKWYA